MPGLRWSFQDEVSADLTDEQWRQIPSGRQHSTAPAADGVAAYWGRHPKGNLLLIPATRHSFTHLNEAGRVRKKLKR